MTPFKIVTMCIVTMVTTGYLPLQHILVIMITMVTM